MDLTINGEPQQLPAPMSVAALLEARGMAGKRVAVDSCLVCHKKFSSFEKARRCFHSNLFAAEPQFLKASKLT